MQSQTSQNRNRPGRNAARNRPRGRQINDGLFPNALLTLEIPSVDPAAGDAQITNLEYIGSYNWLTRPEPTILVPGSPRLWKELSLPKQLSPDRGASFVDQNGHKLPSAPLLPLITAVDLYAEMAGRPPFDWAAVDVVTDRNNLRKLLMWIGGMRGDKKEFRIDMQLVGTTLFLHRWEERPKMNADGHSFGLNFEKAFTVSAPGCGGSTSHHRIIQYDLKGLKVVLRIEVDAALAPESEDVNDLTAALANTTISHPQPPTRVVSLSDRVKLHVQSSNCTILPQSSIMELATLADKGRAFNWDKRYPQLSLSKTSHSVIGFHRKGLIIRIQKDHLSSSSMMARENKLQPDLNKLRQVLEDIRALAVQHGPEARLTLVCTRGRGMEVFRRRSNASMLPDSFIARITSVRT